MATWPTTLPEFETPGYSDAERNNVIRSPNSYGPAKTRQRTTMPLRNIRGQIQVDSASSLVLDQFYADNAAIPFDKLNPRTGLTGQYKFVTPPSYTNLGGDEWLASFDVEVVG